MESSQDNAQQVVHGEDLVGREIQVVVDVTLGDDVNGCDVRLDDFYSSGEVVFGGEVLEGGELTERAIGEAGSTWFGSAEIGVTAVAL